MTSEGRPELPEPRDQFDEKLVADVREYGWHCVLVADEHHPEHAEANAALEPHPVYDAGFAYTVGVGLSFAHPELILIGRWQHAHAILGAVVSLVSDGHRFAAGDESDEVLDGYRVSFAAVSEQRRVELLTCVDWLHHGGPFEALQLILPDSAGRWPEDPAYNAFSQPRLA